jgi:hypothetical protein
MPSPAGRILARSACPFRFAVGEKANDAVGLIPTIGFPNRCFVALELIGHRRGAVARSPCQDDPSALRLELRQAMASSDLQEVGLVNGMYAGPTIWLNWSDSAADPYKKGPEARRSPEARTGLLPFGHCSGTAMNEKNRGANGSHISAGLRLDAFR